MELNVVWTAFAKRELQKIHNYYLDNASKEVAKRLVTAIVTETLQLRKKPKIGQVEPLLDHREKEFRYLLYKNFCSMHFFKSK